MSRSGYSNQATYGSSSSAQQRSDYPQNPHDGTSHNQSGSQNNRLTTQNLHYHASGSMQGASRQGGTQAGTSGTTGAQYSGYQQGQAQGQAVYYTQTGQPSQPRYGSQEVNRNPDPNRGEPFENPYGGNRYNAAQGQSQGQYSYSMGRYAQQDQQYDPYGRDSQSRNPQAYLDDFDTNFGG